MSSESLDEDDLMTSPHPFRLIHCILLVCVGLCLWACDKNTDAPEASAVAAEEADSEQVSAEPAGDEPHHDVHLGAAMNELGERFASIWFAGKAGNAGMVDYQAHEIEELVEELEPAAPVEKGIEVVPRLEADVLEPLEELERAVEDSDSKAFEASYRQIMGNCNACHANTDHAFIQVGLPEYNPYSNLEMKPSR
jgi:hypothetical protein